ncbi:MAG: hypothetical protein UR48_C0045G0009 [Microgenomates group bacterium GW2011_GWD1_33_9]|nr:MAG: hypothetical protein UR48_C0045G0009 [Microgenomates group bacterium GW2011_GWD1_33_9]
MANFKGSFGGYQIGCSLVPDESTFKLVEEL